MDIIVPFAVRRYNQVADPRFRLPDLPRGLFIGHTRAAWPAFVDAYRRDPALRAARDPLDRWTERVVGEMAARMPERTEVRFVHDAPPRRVAMQQLAQVIGLAARAPSCLSVHPVYGPWFAMRAVICVDAPEPEHEPAPVTLPCECERACMPCFSAAMASADDTPTDAHVAEQWKLWLDVRDACPVGREYRYSDAQIRYHYTKDRAAITA